MVIFPQLRVTLPLLMLSLVISPPAFYQTGAPNSGDANCERLAQLKLPATTITIAELVPAGTFSGPPAIYSGKDLTQFYKTLPAFCRVVARATPAADSDIKIEVWMPATEWNGKLQGIGNGGFAGQIDYGQLGTAVLHGYAVTATDTGHSGTPIDAAWALGHPEKVIDFGHRAVHEMTRIAKGASKGFYGHIPERSYFWGCSDGGREALMEAQRYPDDYDGILAGAPANYWTALLSAAVWNTQALTLDAASFIPPAKIPSIANAVLAACDSLDRVRDGVLNEPPKCHFDPASMLCKKGEDTDKCLTAPQAEALTKLYQGPQDSRGHSVFPGYLPGAEDGPGGWGLWITGPAPNKSLMALFGTGYFSNMVYEKKDWDYRTFMLDEGMKAAAEKTASALDANNPDLGAFQARGGKLILYHGWNDPAIPALNTINYYQSVLNTMGRHKADGFVRLYMVPGMQHCGGGPGVDAFGQDGYDPRDPHQNLRLALEDWVAKDTAPGSVVAAKYAPNDSEHHVTMTRPLCSYPSFAKYKGSGDTNEAANFVCAEKEK
ncbi:MAG TPA: tannase/feruloyl esterase family alpha/beta hydrolase [Candidatus Eisenbacteria bacterium]|nr:tannase/feruloyl esterase family alpha/beta hydrolase [Candidatus Eisenbacteria bacterium]